MTVKVRDVPRETDDRVLGWLAGRLKGVAYAELGRPFGAAAGTVRNACKAVAADDKRYGGEPVEGWYP